MRRAGPDDYRESIQRFKAMLRHNEPLDISEFRRPEFRQLRPAERRKLEQVRKAYIRRGQALWNYARVMTKELPEPERQKEMDEIGKLLERAGHPEFCED
jgi:hypothetical protein